MKVNWVSVLLQAINFLVLVVILKRVLYGRIQEVLAQRRADVEKQLADAAAEGARAVAERAKAEALTRSAALECDRALVALHAQTELERAKLQEAARREVEDLVATGRKRLADERDEAGKQLEEAASRLSVSLAERVLEELDPRAVTGLLLERALAHVDALEPNRLEPLRRELAQGGVTVATASPLDDDARGRTATRLAGRLGIAPERVSFAIDPGIHGGTEIRFPSSAVSFTWHGAIERLAREVFRHEHAR